MNVVYGRAFERIAADFLAQKLELTEAKRQWGKIPKAEEGINAYEIDLIAKNKDCYHAFEFKWSDLTEKKALALLKEILK